MLVAAERLLQSAAALTYRVPTLNSAIRMNKDGMPLTQEKANRGRDTTLRYRATVVTVLLNILFTGLCFTYGAIVPAAE